MRFSHRLLLIFLLIASLSVTFSVNAGCTPSNIGTTGNDVIDCTSSPTGGSVTGLAGDDIIIIESNVFVATTDSVTGDNVGAGTVDGNDTIINNGNSYGIFGDSSFGGGNGGNDTIINNGIVRAGFGGGGGDDTIINNGRVDNAVDIIGDTPANGNGNDNITNNGVITGDIIGDSTAVATGNDTINNNGSVTSIYSDNTTGTGTGNDTITNNGTVNGTILAGGGTDTVIIGANTAQVGGTIDGGAGYDVLTLNLTSTDPAVLYDAAAQIAAANPNGGTITLAGHTYTWANFEELTRLIFSMTRLNGVMDPLAVFCALSGGVDVYLVSGSTGVFSLNVSEQVISNGLAQAANNRVQIGASSNAAVYALPTGELEVTGANGFSFSFTYQTYCGALSAPNADTTPVVEEELPAFSIINQPYSG